MDIAWRPAHHPASPLPRTAPPPPWSGPAPYAEPPVAGDAVSLPEWPALPAAPPAVRPPDLRTPATIGYAFFLAAVSVPVLPLATLGMAYLKRREAAGTIYASHFDWQIGTFWRLAGGGAAALAAGYAVAALSTAGAGLAVGGILAFGFCMQGLDRVLTGWTRLKEGNGISRDGKPVPPAAMGTPGGG
jgi:uncharacterized membrane protein